MSPAIRMTLRIIESLGIAFGPAIVALNLFSYNLTRSGTIYYKDGPGWGIAIGVFFICLALVARKWQRFQ